MEKWIPYEKLSKKKQRELAAKGRRGWGGVCPVTRKPPNPKAYNRRKTPRWEEMPPCRGVLFAEKRMNRKGFYSNHQKS